jgi:hypothetical protein
VSGEEHPILKSAQKRLVQRLSAPMQSRPKQAMFSSLDRRIYMRQYYRYLMIT